jgi:hypothetical protein
MIFDYYCWIFARPLLATQRPTARTGQEGNGRLVAAVPSILSNAGMSMKHAAKAAKAHGT